MNYVPIKQVLVVLWNDIKLALPVGTGSVRQFRLSFEPISWIWVFLERQST